MRTVINFGFYCDEASSRFEDFLLSNPSCHKNIQYDKETGVAIVDSDDIDFIETLITSIGGKYPMAFMVVSGSDDEQIVRDVYDGLPEAEKSCVDITLADVGSRVSVSIDPRRTDIQAKFWRSLYPLADVDSRSRGGRARGFSELHVKVPEELEATALRVGDWSKTIIFEDGVYVSDEDFLRRLREEDMRFKKCKNAISYSVANKRQKDEGRRR